MVLILRCKTKSARELEWSPQPSCFLGQLNQEHRRWKPAGGSCQCSPTDPCLQPRWRSVALEWWFSVCVCVQQHQHHLGRCKKMHILQPHPRPAESELWGIMFSALHLVLLNTEVWGPLSLRKEATRQQEPGSQVAVSGIPMLEYEWEINMCCFESLRLSIVKVDIATLVL